mgnify:CR=1 FL=1|uniref:Upper collar protein n=1 Tax=Podoviridae sp. cty7j44 TaxID=2826593 RepID=A0A8S5QYC4_9CAUD|nr:MAG TPA: upper collar protein [Podoviridae sp. cty7j44]
MIFDYFGNKFRPKWIDIKDKESMLGYHINQKLIQCQSIFEYEGLPDSIPKRDLELTLQVCGFTAIIKEKNKLYALWGGLGGERNAYYNPTLATIANPYLNIGKGYEIGKDTVVVRNDALWQGFMPIHQYYASQIVENDISRNSLLINARLFCLLSANTDDEKDDIEEVYKALEKGDLKAVLSNPIMGKIESLPLASQNVTNTLISLLEDKQYIKGSWWNEMGVQSNYNMKRETITSNENILNVDSLLPFIDNCLECRKEGFDKVNEMFGTNIKVDFSSSWKKVRDEIAISEEREKTQVQSTEQPTDDNKVEDKKDGEENENN